MKKIVALVLALVMVLGLATTASAATVANTVDKAVSGTHASALWNGVVVDEDAINEKDSEFATYSIELTALSNSAKVWWIDNATAEKGDDEDFVFGGDDEFVKVVGVAADFVVVDGSTVTYFAKASTYANGWDEKAEKVVLPYAVADKRECDTFYATNPAATTFYKFANTLFVACTKAESTIVFNVDGLAVPAKVATTEVTYKDHTYKMDSQGNSYGEKVLTKVYCGVCGANFDFVVGSSTAAVTKFGVNNYADTGLTWPAETGKTVWVGSVVADAPAADTTTETVESAKTFDAGIAMYVGMSVMAAAGSAVVLKKKD